MVFYCQGTAKKTVIAISAREILLNYTEAYSSVWERIVGISPADKDADGGDHFVRWSPDQSMFTEKRKFLASLDQVFWRSVPETTGASGGCSFLSTNGTSIHVILYISERFKPTISDNLISNGFIFSELHVLPRSHTGNLGIEKLLEKINASAFVDGNLPNFRGISNSVHKALIAGRSTENQNSGFELATIDSMHPAVSYFSDWWVNHRVKKNQHLNKNLVYLTDELLTPIRALISLIDQFVSSCRRINNVGPILSFLCRILLITGGASPNLAHNAASLETPS